MGRVSGWSGFGSSGDLDARGEGVRVQERGMTEREVGVLDIDN